LSALRALVLLLLASPALADIPAIAEGDHVIACSHDCGCRVIDPATGKVIGQRATLPSVFDIHDDEPTPEAALARCGKRCAGLRKRLGEETRTVAVDPTRALLFEIDPDSYGYPTRGNVWSLVTGKRITRFALNDFEGPPPPMNFDHAELVGRHVFVGEPGEAFALVYDVFTGAKSMLFAHAKLGHGLVLENDGTGRFDLVDYAQAGHPRVAVRRIRARLEPAASTVMMQVVPVGDKALVLIEDPPVTLLVVPRNRTISKPRPLPACSPP
jgi:hypothetical protein